VLGTAVAIDILLQFVNYSTTPTTSIKKPSITSSSSSSSSACNEKTQFPKTRKRIKFYSIFPDAILFLFSQQQKNKTIPKPQTSISKSTNDRRKPKQDKMKAGKKPGKRLHVLEDDESNSTERNVAKKQNINSVKSELQNRKSKQRRKVTRRNLATSPITSSRDKPSSTNR
jgi:hypothetical protein